MSTDYELVYRAQKDALGKPSKVVIDHFTNQPHDGGSVLDVGCGQGRDALFLARKGYKVTGVDISPTGIADLLTAAKAEKLSVNGHVADLRDFVLFETYDIVLVDRTLHMLESVERITLVKKLLDAVRPGGDLVIIDETPNIPAMVDCIEGKQFTVVKRKRGFLAARRSQ